MRNGWRRKESWIGLGRAEIKKKSTWAAGSGCSPGRAEVRFSEIGSDTGFESDSPAAGKADTVGADIAVHMADTVVVGGHNWLGVGCQRFDTADWGWVVCIKAGKRTMSWGFVRAIRS